MKVTANKKRLLGFAGRAGVGKSTTADWFVHAQDFVRLSYATPLKEACSALTGLPMKYFTDIELKEQIIPGLNVTPRIIMQKMGTDFIREMIDPDFWIWRMRQSVSENSHRNIVIDDIRFSNEAQFVRVNGGIVIHLNRSYDSVTDQMNHASEIPLIPHDDDMFIESLETSADTALLINGLLLYK